MQTGVGQSRTLVNIHAKYGNSNIAVFTPTCIPAQSRTSETAYHKLDLRTLEKTETQRTFVNYSILKKSTLSGLSKPHTSVTTLNMFVGIYLCLFGLTTYRTFK